MLDLDKIKYLDTVLLPNSTNMEIVRYNRQLNQLFKRMAGAKDAADRVLTVGDVGDTIGEAWTDYNVGSTSMGVPISSAPDLINWGSTGIKVRAFDGSSTSEQLFGVIEINHEYAEGTDMYFHVHWAPTTADVGTVKWFLEYTITKAGDTTASSTTVTCSQPTPGVAWTHMIAEFPAISGVGVTVGAQLAFRIYRTPADSSDTYAADAAMLTAGLHVRVNSFGSRTKYFK